MGVKFRSQHRGVNICSPLHIEVRQFRTSKLNNTDSGFSFEVLFTVFAPFSISPWVS
jgi:hypothetical protein